MKTFGANFYLTFTATDEQHARTIAAAIVTTHNADGEAHLQLGTLLPAEEDPEDWGSYEDTQPATAASSV